MQGSRGFALIHGAGLGTWIWEEVAADLDDPHLACEFPGRDAEPPTPQQPLADYASHVERQIAGWPVHDVVLVAHSAGGVVALRVAQALGARVVGFIAVAAAIPRDGGSYLSTLPLPQRFLSSAVMRLFGTRPPTATIRSGTCSDLPTEATADVIDHFVAESRRLYTDPVQAPIPAVPRLYIRTTEDQEFSLRHQNRMMANLGTDRAVDLRTGHLPMLSAPGELADVLNRFAELTS
jgi:pimeloyl-ACP methyl ester carboxylesterase